VGEARRSHIYASTLKGIRSAIEPLHLSSALHRNQITRRHQGRSATPIHAQKRPLTMTSTSTMSGVTCFRFELLQGLSVSIVNIATCQRIATLKYSSQTQPPCSHSSNALMLLPASRNSSSNSAFRKYLESGRSYANHRIRGFRSTLPTR
jgi:hypothetical protein